MLVLPRRTHALAALTEESSSRCWPPIACRSRFSNPDELLQLGQAQGKTPSNGELVIQRRRRAGLLNSVAKVRV